MDSKPIITVAGDQKLFSTLETAITEGLPEESVQWRRSYGRSPKMVYVTANFVPFTEEIIPKEKNGRLLGQSFFHTYWTDCADVEHYKHTVREDINLWMSKLKSRNIQDWCIITVDYSDSKRSNKKLLPRTTVLDKIKNDFPSKNSERCISLLDQCKTDGRNTESWQLLLRRLRDLLLQAYGRQLLLYEDHMRTRREKRNEPGWNYCDFFFLQEELAFVFEMLGLYDEALVQYDELDALFTQFVINSNVGGIPDWLNSFTQSCNTWAGLCLLRSVAEALHEAIKKDKNSLLEFRNYLFSRQCTLLLLLCRPWEVAERTLPFLYNTIGELRVLEVEMPPGSLASWVILSCLEVLQTCERFSDSTQMESYSLYTASLWEYTRQKFRELGVLCGLMPDMVATSENLHLVVGLLAGMGENPYPDSDPNSPQARLREAVSSKDGFLKHYLEISELTMGTFKHIGRIRTARLIGRDLAQLYMKMNQPSKAVTFLVDLLKTYQSEKWDSLASVTREEIAECYQAMKDDRKYATECAHLATSLTFDANKRQRFFKELLSFKTSLQNDVLLLRTEELFCLDDVRILCFDKVIICGSELELTMNVENNFPDVIECQTVRVSLKFDPVSKPSAASHGHQSPARSSCIPNSTSFGSRTPHNEWYHPLLDLIIEHDYRQDGSLDSAGIICRNTQEVLQRTNSHGATKEREIEKENHSLCFVASDVCLNSGKNQILLKTKVNEAGSFILQELYMEWGNIHFISPQLVPLVSFNVVYEPALIKLHSKQGDLLAGVEQTLNLSVYSGSNNITQGTLLHLKASLGLSFHVNNDGDWVEETDVALPAISAFDTVCLSFEVLANLGPQRDANMIEHKIILNWQEASQPFVIQLHFLPPFLTTHKLHTCGPRKYLQVAVHGLSDNVIMLSDASLIATDTKDAELKLINPPKPAVVINGEQSTCYLWEVIHEELETLPVNFLFAIHYKREDFPTDPFRKYQCDIHLNNYTTLYTIRASVEPPKGSEFCRAGTVCQMHIMIAQLQSPSHTSLMYEVVTDQTWAVCGRTAGVINVDSSGKHNVTLDAMPLTSGFLPLPTVRLSKYIPAEYTKAATKDSGQQSKASTQNIVRLEPFYPGQVYSWSRATQLHVLPATAAPANLEMPS